MKRMIEFLKRQPSGRLIPLGFATVILIGTLLLFLPISANPGKSTGLLDALFTSASAVCVTGLVVVDTAEQYSVFGRTVIALLIQVGGLGVASVGVGIMLVAGKKLGMKSVTLFKESINSGGMKGALKMVKAVLITTLIFEGAGAILSYPSFLKHYDPVSAVGVSVFHSIASFNNAGFDIIGGFQNMIPYSEDVLLNVVTALLIIFGGLGFLVIVDVCKKRRFKTLTLHSKVVISTTLFLIVFGTLVLKGTEKMGWMEAAFQSVSARTAGFCTLPIGELKDAGLFILVILMFIGASPGSTGGGIKTSTFFALVQSAKSIITKKHTAAFHRSIGQEAVTRAYNIAFLSGVVVCTGTFLLSILEPEYTFMQNLFEVTSAFGTVGLSTGITPDLCGAAKVVIILIMFIGRVGAFSLLSGWINRPTPNVRYLEEHIAIG